MTRRSIAGRLALPLVASAVLAGCAMDDQSATTLPGSSANLGNGLFDRYVALGNSITAGYQSGGINDSTQRQSYAVLLARKANVVFNVPLLNKPGCPPPFLAPLGTTGRVGSGTAGTCALRTTPVSGPVQNLAVPGATVGSITSNTHAPNTLTTLILGGRTQAQAMLDADPTFVSMWIGNNDALGAALGGRLGPSAPGADSALTPLSTFQARLAAAVDAINATDAEGAALIGVVDAVTAAPLIQPGAFFFLARDGAGNFNGKPVNNNCSPVTGLGTPNPLAANMVSFSILSDANFAEINCDPDAYPVGDPRRGVYLLDTAEQAVVRTRVAQFNAAIQAAAAANGWVYLDPNAVLAPYISPTPAPAKYDFVRKCQLLATASTPSTFQAAVVNSCPIPPASGGAPNFFGSLISFDGVHPTAAAHVIVANELAARINAAYGTRLPTS
jgi:hypothetical protein